MDYKERCKDCFYLFEDEKTKEWCCDCHEKLCSYIIKCPQLENVDEIETKS